VYIFNSIVGKNFRKSIGQASGENVAARERLNYADQHFFLLVKNVIHILPRRNVIETAALVIEFRIPIEVVYEVYMHFLKRICNSAGTNEKFPHIQKLLIHMYVGSVSFSDVSNA